MFAGLDEAGRGPVVGPLVVGLVATDDVETVRRLGVKDSKVLTPARREELYPQILSAASYVKTVHTSAMKLDSLMRRKTLNAVEMDVFTQLGRDVPAHTYYLDACDVNAQRFGKTFLRRLYRTPPLPTIVSEHHADANHPLVAAASIVAKVERDRAIAEIARRLEPLVGVPLGSGYSHDDTTRAFLQRYLEVHRRLPEDVRAAWATSQTLTQERFQRRLPKA